MVEKTAASPLRASARIAFRSADIEPEIALTPLIPMPREKEGKEARAKERAKAKERNR